MKQNERNSRKRLNSLILLVAFTAVMLIVSTYAWFSTQKNVTISGITGKVQVAEGLQISLDAKTWTSSIDLADFDVDGTTGIMTSNEYLTSDIEGTSLSFQQPYVLNSVDNGGTLEHTYASNIVPSELKPMSTTGGTNEGIGKDRLQMYWGENTQFTQLDGIELLNATTEQNYYAFDIFLQNSSAVGMVYDTLLLEPNSSLTVPLGKETTGLQNAVRVAFALYENNTDDAEPSNDNTVTVADTPTTKQIISGTAYNKKIKDVAIWEPNADAHVENIVISNNNVKWSKEDLQLYRFDIDAGAAAVAKFVGTPVYEADGTTVQEGKVAQFHTYALTASSINSKFQTKGADTTETDDDDWSELGSIKDVYNWADGITGTNGTGLKKQYTLQTKADLTAKDGLLETEKLELQSVAKLELANDADPSNDPAHTAFQIGAGQYHKIRVYVWLEGQDVDCTNFASLGGQVTLDLGFSKYGSEDEKYPS